MNNNQQRKYILALVKANDDEVESLYQKVKTDKSLNIHFGNPTKEDYFDKNNTTFKIEIHFMDNPKINEYISVGYVAVLKNEDGYCIWSLYVDKEYRNMSIATETLTRLGVCLGKSSYVYGFCHLDNPAFNFYAKRFKFLKKDRETFDYIYRNEQIDELYVFDSGVEVLFNPFFK